MVVASHKHSLPLLNVCLIACFAAVIKTSPCLEDLCRCEHLLSILSQDSFKAFLLPIEVLFAEHHSKAYATPRSGKFVFSGLSLPVRQIWTWMCILFTATFSSTMKSNLIKEPEKKLISHLHEMVGSGIPVRLFMESYTQVEMMKYSPFWSDRWLYENVEDVTL